MEKKILKKVSKENKETIMNALKEDLLIIGETVEDCNIKKTN